MTANKQRNATGGESIEDSVQADDTGLGGGDLKDGQNLAGETGVCWKWGKGIHGRWKSTDKTHKGSEWAVQ